MTEAHPWTALVRERGGAPLRSLDDAAGFDPAAARFAALLCRDRGILPAVARLTPAQAAALLIVLGEPQGTDAGAANRLCQRLAGGDSSVYLLKAGAVGGDGEGRSLEIEADHAEAILDAIGSGAIVWERDPDFGYELAADVAGLGGGDVGLLIPRFLYARTDRVYEHAALVPQLKEERRRLLLRLDGLAPEIVAAVG